MAYNRERAVTYAHTYAFSRNPRYYDFSAVGGDCTNFCSQCLHAGGAAMNYTPTLGWYYTDARHRAPAWSGVPYLFNFLTANTGTGPYGAEAPLGALIPGDIIQLSFDGTRYSHSLFVVATGPSGSPAGILIATHSQDSDNRPLASYSYASARGIHIEGTRP